MMTRRRVALMVAPTAMETTIKRMKEDSRAAMAAEQAQALEVTTQMMAPMVVLLLALVIMNKETILVKTKIC